MRIEANVRKVLTPSDLKEKKPMLVQCQGETSIEWRDRNGETKSSPAINFVGGLDGETYDVKIFGSRLWVPPKTALEVTNGKRYYLKYHNEKQFEIAEFTP